MGLYKTSSFSIFTFMNASDLKFAHVLTAAVYRMMSFKDSNGKFAKS